MRFPLNIERYGWNGSQPRNRHGDLCPVEPTFVDTFGADRDGGARTHEGIDVFAGIGTVIVAPEAGRVSRGEGELSGKLVRIDSRGGRRWTFAHLNGYLGPSSGDVAEGTPLGYVGTTGNVHQTCPHVHIELRQNGTLVNPFNILEPLLQEERARVRMPAPGRLEELRRLLAEVVQRWNASAEPLAREAAITMRQVLQQSAELERAGRGDVALDLLRSAVQRAAQAPPEWGTPDDFLSRAERLLTRAAGAAAEGAMGGLSIALLLLLGIGAWALSRQGS